MSKSSELDRTVKQYILSCISEDSEGNQYNIIDSIEHVKTRFESEYNHEIQRKGYQNAMREWLMGLALNIEFMNYEILKLAVKWDSIPDNYTEKQAEKILDNYWNFMAAKLCQLIKGYRVPGSMKS